MASTGSNVNDCRLSSMTTLTEFGTVYHCIGPPSLPEEGAVGPAFAQFYIVDSDAANNSCLNIIST